MTPKDATRLRCFPAWREQTRHELRRRYRLHSREAAFHLLQNVVEIVGGLRPRLDLRLEDTELLVVFLGPFHSDDVTAAVLIERVYQEVKRGGDPVADALAP